MSNDDACVGEACVRATCGDGFLRTDLGDDHPDFEQCDDGDQRDSNHCTNLCKEARCGDGVVNLEIPARDPSFEGCDDGNGVDTDGCRNDCLREVLPGRLAVSGFGGCRQTLDEIWSCWGPHQDGRFGQGTPPVDAGTGGSFQITLSEETPGPVEFRFRANRTGSWQFEVLEASGVLVIVRDANDHVVGFSVDGHNFVETLVESYATYTVTVQAISDWAYGVHFFRITAPQGGNSEDAVYDVLDRGSPLPVVERGSSMAAGASHKCVISPSGQVRCFGASNFGQAGVGHGDGPALEPVGIDMRPSVPGSLSVRGNIGCSLRSLDQSVMCWGQINADGQPNPQDYQVTSRRVFALMDGVCAQKQDGRIWCEGNNQVGSLGLGETERLEAMTLVDSFGKPAQIQGSQWASLGDITEQLELCDGGTDCHNHTCVLHQDRSIRCTGANRWGQVGVAEPAIVRELTTVAFTGFPVSLAVGGYHTCLLDIVGKVHCWGYNGFGQLGQEPSQDPTFHKVSTPTEVLNLTGVTEIAAGAHHTCALVGNQQVKCWGLNHQAEPFEVGEFSHEPTEVQRLMVNHAPTFTGDALPAVVALSSTIEYTVNDLDNDETEVSCTCSAPDGRLVGVDVNATSIVLALEDIGAEYTCEVILSDATGRVTRHLFRAE
jgi:cysteine-rich repeat protein